MPTVPVRACPAASCSVPANFTRRGVLVEHGFPPSVHWAPAQGAKAIKGHNAHTIPENNLECLLSMTYSSDKPGSLTPQTLHGSCLTGSPSSLPTKAERHSRQLPSSPHSRAPSSEAEAPCSENPPRWQP